MLKKIRFELARTKEFPEGNARCGYELMAPLDPTGHIDPDGWAKAKDKCTVRRFWERAADEHGKLRKSGQSHWYFDYGPGTEDDEPVFKLDRHVFK